jgi:hypothetical protein
MTEPKNIENIWECAGYKWVQCAHCGKRIKKNIVVTTDRFGHRYYFCCTKHAMFWKLKLDQHQY